ncbi:hypothetical protein ACIRYZ_36670 [Kitasatospora sp. NPDC101155]|uniref:hypothetical protein n=1 Tax=Kitasatospora sp. NPDC101155 TaxID=3364097 RepID=UPI003807E2AD
MTWQQNIGYALAVTGGLELASHLLVGEHDAYERIAVQLLGRHGGGRWLRALCVPDRPELDAGLADVIDLRESPVRLNWRLLAAALQVPQAFRQPADDLAMLEIATSIAGPHRVNLRSALSALHPDDRRLAAAAVQEAALLTNDDGPAALV